MIPQSFPYYFYSKLWKPLSFSFQSQPHSTYSFYGASRTSAAFRFTNKLLSILVIFNRSVGKIFSDHRENIKECRKFGFQPTAFRYSKRLRRSEKKLVTCPLLPQPHRNDVTPVTSAASLWFCITTPAGGIQIISIVLEYFPIILLSSSENEQSPSGAENANFHRNASINRCIQRVWNQGVNTFRGIFT